MLSISIAISHHIRRHFEAATSSDRECRLVVPGLTATIAEQMHQILREANIVSYLVVGQGQKVSEESRRMRANGLTGKRFGSFVAIASSGQLSEIQDSIRGTGGAIRALAFSEEWPWRSNESDLIHFDNELLDDLTKRWGADDDEQKKWLMDYIKDILLKNTKNSAQRKRIFLEQMLGEFSADLYPEIPDMRKKFLYHTGVPYMDDSFEIKMIKNGWLPKLCKKIVDRCNNEQDIRQNIRGMVDTVKSLREVDERKKSQVRNSLDLFIDGVGNKPDLREVLSLYKCWGPDKNDTLHWQHLDANLLHELFCPGIDIDNGKLEEEQIKISCETDCPKCVKFGKNLATFHGNKINMSIKYWIPKRLFQKYSNWRMRVTNINRRRTFEEKRLEGFSGEHQFVLDTAQLEKYDRKISFQVAIMRDDAAARKKTIMALHLCGKMRPAFAIAVPEFECENASDDSEEEGLSGRRIGIDVPVHLFLLGHNHQEVKLTDDDDQELGLDEGNDVLRSKDPGDFSSSSGPAHLSRKERLLWSKDPVDFSSSSGGEIIRKCKFDNLVATFIFESGNVKGGEFTIEEEFIAAVSDRSNPRSPKRKKLFEVFSGASDTPYYDLGKIDKPAYFRIHLAEYATREDGWRPLLTDLFLASNEQPEGDKYIGILGAVESREKFKNIDMPDTARSLLERYSGNRQKIIDRIRSLFRKDAQKTMEHPIYARNPIFVNKNAAEIEALIEEYLISYRDILEYVTASKSLEWNQLFIAVYIDCVVHWGKAFNGAFFLLGPWHPLCLSSRFMVQSSLFAKAKRIVEERDLEFMELTRLLAKVQGFRWHLGLPELGKDPVPAYVASTSDPGWRFAMRRDTELSPKAAVEKIPELTEKLKHSLGLSVMSRTGNNKTLAANCLSDFRRAFPSRRSVGIQVKSGYNEEEIVEKVSEIIHDSDGADKEIGKLFPGGIRLYFEKEIGNVEKARYVNPPLRIFRFAEDSQCNKEGKPDIYMLPAADDLSTKQTESEHSVPRGVGRNAVFSRHLCWLTDGGKLTPTSIIYEYDVSESGASQDKNAYTSVIKKINSILGKPVVTTLGLEIPDQLRAPWVIIPSFSIDPAALVKYVKELGDVQRLLWDYNVDITGKDNSYYVLSTIPKRFEAAVQDFSGGLQCVIGKFISELGAIGVAVGSETLKTGRTAKGVIGLVGAIKLLVGKNGSLSSACDNEASFLVPIDSFASFFGERSEENSKRADLLAVRLLLTPEKRLMVSAWGVEAKYTSGTYSQTQVARAIEQAGASHSDFKKLVEASLGKGGMPERLALLDFLSFGLRISTPQNEEESSVKREACIYSAILAGNYQYLKTRHNALLVSTEIELPQAALIDSGNGLWVRLTQKHWPEIHDTESVKDIQRKLRDSFKPDNRFFHPSEKGAVNSVLPANAVDDKSSSDSPQGAAQQSNKDVMLARKESGNFPSALASLPQSNKAVVSGQPTQDESPIRKMLLGFDVAAIQPVQPIYYDPKATKSSLTNMNMMVTGSSGTGKTQLLKYLVCKAREQGKNVLLVDMKNDFASDKAFCEKAGLAKIFVGFDGLPMNPLIPYPTEHPGTGEKILQIGQFIAGVADVFKQVYKLGDQQQVAVRKSIENAFSEAGIKHSGSIPYTDGLPFPDFSDVGKILEGKDMAAYNRLSPLFTLELFKEEFRSKSFQDLISKAAVLDLSKIQSDQIKNALAQLIVMTSHSYYNARSHSGDIRQFLIFDEAHRVVESSYMLKFARECRAYGVGMVLSSQYPSDFPPDISASMATKIIHGNGMSADRVRQIGKLLGCEESDRIEGLQRFEAIINNDHHSNVFIRTMHYPLYLVFLELKKKLVATPEQLSFTIGIDTSKLSIDELVQQLIERGLAKMQDGKVFPVGEDFA